MAEFCQYLAALGGKLVDPLFHVFDKLDLNPMANSADKEGSLKEEGGQNRRNFTTGSTRLNIKTPTRVQTRQHFPNNL